MIRPQEIRLIGQPVRSLQTMLRALSYQYDFLPRLTPDGVFGERTLEAVMRFQRAFAPPVTGKVDQATWDAIAEAYRLAQPRLGPSATLRGYPDNPAFSVAPDQASIHLYVIQSMFRALARVLTGFQAGAVTGVNDSTTAANIRYLQRLGGSRETGIMDRESWNLLSRLYSLFVSGSQS